MTKILHNPSDKYYHKALLKEISIDTSARNPQWPPDLDLHPKLLAYYNSIYTGNPEENEFDWYSVFSGRNYKHCLTLGSHNGRHELFLTSRQIAEHWDSIVLTKPPVSQDEDKGKHFSFVIGDLNFLELPEKKYDLIFCNGVLHHIINLEHLLAEINKALTEDGIFVCAEYIGESKWQWCDQKLSILNTLLHQHYGSLTFLPEFRRPTIEMMNTRPFESIRSQEIPRLLDHYFSVEYYSSCDYILYPGINYVNFNDKFQDYICAESYRLEQYLETLIQSDYQIHSDNKAGLLPNSMAGVFCKKESVNSITVPAWTSVEIKYHLSPPKDRLHMKIKRKLRKLFA